MRSKENHTVLEQDHYIKRIKVPLKREYRGKCELNQEEQTRYRALVGKLNWLSQQTRSDLAFNVSERSQKNNQATNEDMRTLIKITEKSKEECCEKLEKLCGKLQLEVYEDASFGGSGNYGSQTGYIISLIDERGNRAPIYWKSHKTRRIARSTLEAETLSIVEAAEV